MKSPSPLPRISVITICLNSEKTLRHTIESVLQQKYPQLEYIVVDGGSRDGTLNLLKEYGHGISKWISEKDKGVADAFNKGARLATGDWVAFLNSDDYYAPGALHRIAQAHLTTDGAADMLYGSAYGMEKGIPLYIMDAPPLDRINVLSSFVCHQAIFARRTLFQTVGLFNTRLHYTSDYDWSLRCLKNNISCRAVEGPPLVYYSLEGKAAQYGFRALLERRRVAIRNGHTGLSAHAFYLWKMLKYGLQHIGYWMGLKSWIIGYKTRSFDIYKPLPAGR